jgi:hypothetical protein
MNANTLKKFEIGERRFLVLKKKEVKIFNNGSPKLGTVRRFLRRKRSERGKAGRRSAGGGTAAHVGASRYVSVTSGY